MVLLDVVQEIDSTGALNRRYIIQVSVDTCVYRQHLIGDRHRFVLPLLKQLHHSNAARKLPLCRFVELAAELGERGHFSVLREVKPKGASHLLHGFDLGRTPDAGADRPTLIAGRIRSRTDHWQDRSARR